MASEQVPANPDIISWARARAAFSVEDASQYFSKIADWEAGLSSPTYPQLERLAEKFKIPVAVFFFPEPPELPATNESFRTLTRVQIEQMPRKVRFLLREAEALKINLSELYGGRSPSERMITRELRFDIGANYQDMAATVREFIGITIEEQIQQPSRDDAFKQWRHALANCGVFVFKEAFKSEDYSGFCLYDESYPIIFVNNSSAPARQIFTLFHELAHLLFETSGIDTVSNSYAERLEGDNRRIEVFCNRFAAEFLLPEAEYRRAMDNLDPTEDSATLLASHYNVSREVVFRKFLDDQRIDQETYRYAAERWALQRRGGDGGNSYWTKIAYLGRDYMDLVFSQYHQNKFDQEKLADYLGWKPRHLDSLEAYYFQGVI